MSHHKIEHKKPNFMNIWT